MTRIIDIIEQAENGDIVSFEQTFQEIMTENVGELLDDLRESAFSEDLEDLDEDQLDELSKKTLGSYIGKAASSYGGIGYDIGHKNAQSDEIDRHMNDKHNFNKTMKKMVNVDSKSISKIRDKGKVRLHGINTAVKKLTQDKE